MVRQYTVDRFKQMSEAQLRTRRNEAEKRVTQEEKRNRKVYGKPVTQLILPKRGK